MRGWNLLHVMQFLCANDEASCDDFFHVMKFGSYHENVFGCIMFCSGKKTRFFSCSD